MVSKLKNFYKVVRGFLILTILMNVAISAFYLISNQNPELENIIREDLSFRLQLVFVATITLVATYLPSYLDSRTRIRLPEILEITVIVFVIAAGYLSQRFNLFVRFHWWDDLLHFTSGTFIAVAGFLLIYMLNHRYSFDLNPWLIAIFTFSFSVAIAVFWEIAEFAADALWRTNYQKWDVPADTPLLGKSYQGYGLRDTMADLIIASTGAFIVSVFAYFAADRKKEETIKRISKLIKKRKKNKRE
ncbi:MAG: hypothetical protein GX102_04850 [Porphyromonadaceae bacterium]|jgi:hypothetical protein|nr:hypothetical protein [Porphyromonadaceae bacterium]